MEFVAGTVLVLNGLYWVLLSISSFWLWRVHNDPLKIAKMRFTDPDFPIHRPNGFGVALNVGFTSLYWAAILVVLG